MKRKTNNQQPPHMLVYYQFRHADTGRNERRTNNQLLPYYG
jgi:hypothetical protein